MTGVYTKRNVIRRSHMTLFGCRPGGDLGQLDEELIEGSADVPNSIS